MLILAIILFIAAVVCGLVLLIAILQDRATNKIAKKFHGVLAGTALIIMIVYALTSIPVWSTHLIISMTLLVLAGLGGLTLFMLDRKKKPIPKIIAVVHPLIAFVGLLSLILYVLP